MPTAFPTRYVLDLTREWYVFPWPIYTDADGFTLYAGVAVEIVWFRDRAEGLARHVGNVPAECSGEKRR